ncbi:MAG TPA: alpha-amylase family glycosyl hydrolase [Solirubrobacterales bacterium]|nr:alpha-amylase family glycosyl hydrolase [Solirubrobacterales bacterium]
MRAPERDSHRPSGSSGARTGADPWWRDAVVYQVYPRSFRDSDGDGVGDLTGIIERLDYIAGLGVDAIWLSPIYPSPLADSGYDVSDHTGVDPALGSLDDVDRLLAGAHRRGLRVLLDLIPSHTSIEHPWFRRHPDWYVWSDRDGPQNNWRAAFGGPAWSRDDRTGRWYLHSFYPEQPDLDWRKAEVREAIARVVRFWIERGIDGFRVDAAERIAKDPELRDDPVANEPFPLPLHPEHGELEHRHSRGFDQAVAAMATLREAAGDALLVGEVYMPTDRVHPYLECFDLVFSFELLHSRWDGAALAAAISPAAELGRVAWVLGNHDFPRIASRVGRSGARLAAMLLLTLPGTAFVYQGDEIGMLDGPGGSPPRDRHGRDAHRHPMQWTPTAGGGFSTGDPWLPALDPEQASVAGQEGDPASLLELHRRLIAIRHELGRFELLDPADGAVAYRRGDHAVALNLTATEVPLPVRGEVAVATAPAAAEDGETLRPGHGVVLRAST